ncbi:hypothetical protein QO001_000856 [Methylobacterium brachiatum]|jgi:hypothetical protein|uniref:Uncharacterized protein n=1 Tax=Methylobacterium brachiatum TaxID=269660 RepID=A0AAJ1WW96_9HYPH|nr:hypothetical protein [Methylobacterium brachiatum]MCB4803511.1 hypothetical protein [Methylobacterium brachiatum]MDQ0541948.1 hypothetical protein [Methylobacterium brachiatum]
MTTKLWAWHPDGVVDEVVELPSDWVPGRDIYTPEYAADLTDVTGVSPQPSAGWTTADGGKTFMEPAPAPTPVPAAVSSAQAKIQLLRTPGSADDKTLLDDVMADVQKAGGEVAIWFSDARTWERANPYVAQLGKSRKLKDADIDALFVAAAQIAA